MPTDKYTRKELERIASQLVGEKVTLIPIGNHDLNRHLVYKLTTSENQHFVFKYFYQSHYASREIAALKYLATHKLPVPKIINSGALDDQRTWLLMTYIEGLPMMKILRHIPIEQQLRLFEELGKVLKAFHTVHFDHFGTWNTLQLTTPLSLKTAYQPKLDFLDQRLADPDLPNREWLNLAWKYLEDHMSCLDYATEAVLCHQDFDARNILIRKIGENYEITAVLDFEHSVPWDSYADFSQLYLKHFYDHPELEVAFFRGYHPSFHSDPHFDERFKYHLLYYTLSACSWAYDIAPDFYEMCMKTLKRLLK
ncbi:MULTISPECIES: phosphotransferase family protein [unclassified Fusibacter]|uniref:phosphotransferase family protein n=1 Tax=unclassified Fusibacter TaxID=2624464 RepID=UPI001010EE1F|nr:MULTISPECIES: aminoglycoside phosphotransferase family protein [unclassified Fusibacter]MCK8059920.1 aminoglycoside phosphotransferase family protein [Fusibacter sp. A2]NPE22062.1 aminoglycoside phosphotransferase family protein [Fusibacter sp. A1]RXV60842.1 aminoglycoside phosphotransferase family protein [Fusibacter sp. A1]